MNELIKDTINWGTIGNHEINKYCYSIEKAVIDKENSTLNINLKLNFVIPFLDLLRIKALIINKIDLLNDVEFDFIYENVILTPEEIIELYIPYMVLMLNGKFAIITKTIQVENFTYDGQKIEILAFGKLATEQLNEKVAQKFGNLLKENFGIECEVIFRNNESLYNKTNEEILDWDKLERKEFAENRFRNPPNKEIKQNKTESYGKATWPKKEKESQAVGNRIMGKEIIGKGLPLESLSAELGTVIIEGVIFKCEARSIKSGKKLITILITDKSTTVCAKSFVSEKKWNEINDLIIQTYMCI